MCVPAKCPSVSSCAGFLAKPHSNIQSCCAVLVPRNRKKLFWRTFFVCFFPVQHVRLATGVGRRRSLGERIRYLCLITNVFGAYSLLRKWYGDYYWLPRVPIVGNPTGLAPRLVKQSCRFFLGSREAPKCSPLSSLQVWKGPPPDTAQPRGERINLKINILIFRQLLRPLLCQDFALSIKRRNISRSFCGAYN